MNQISACFAFLLLAWIVPLIGIADERKSGSIQSTTIEDVTIDGNVVVSIQTGSIKIIAKAVTIEVLGRSLTITTSPQGLEIRSSGMSITGGGKMELQTSSKIVSLDLIRLEIGPQEELGNGPQEELVPPRIEPGIPLPLSFRSNVN